MTLNPVGLYFRDKPGGWKALYFLVNLGNRVVRASLVIRHTVHRSDFTLIRIRLKMAKKCCLFLVIFSRVKTNIFRSQAKDACQMRCPVQNWSREGNYFEISDAVWMQEYLRFEPGALMWNEPLLRLRTWVCLQRWSPTQLDELCSKRSIIIIIIVIITKRICQAPFPP